MDHALPEWMLILKPVAAPADVGEVQFCPNKPLYLFECPLGHREIVAERSAATLPHLNCCSSILEPNELLTTSEKEESFVRVGNGLFSNLIFTLTVCSRIVGFVSRNPCATCGNIWSFTTCGCRWLINKSSCWSSRERVTRSVDANNFTTQGTIRFWYSASSNKRPNLNIGANTAEPASPYSNAVINWGNIFCRHTLSGKLSNWFASAAKNRFFSALSLIWISSRNNSVSTKSFLKKPPGFRHLVMISAGFGRFVGDAPTSSQYKLVNDFGI